MRVVLVAQPIDSVLPPVQNSVGVCTWELAGALGADHEVFVIAAHEGPREETRVGAVNLVLLPRRARDRVLRGALRLRSWLAAHKLLTARPASMSAWLYPSYCRMVCRELRRLAPDVVHLQHSTQYAPRIRAAVPGCALVLQAHSEWASESTRRSLAPRLNAVDAVATVSDWLQLRVLGVFPELRGRVSTVYDGATPGEFAVGDVPAGGAADGPVILFVGAVTPNKGVHDLVDAYAQLIKSFPTARLQIIGPVGQWAVEEFVVGDKTWLPRLREFYRCDYQAALLARLPVAAQSRVTFTGQLSRQEVAARMASATVFAFPSINDEGFGLPPVEAMAAGLPVVVTRAGALPETVVDGVTGIIVDKGRPDQLAAAIGGLLADPERAQRMGLAARERVAGNFTWTAAAHAATIAYERAVAFHQVPEARSPITLVAAPDRRAV